MPLSSKPRVIQKVQLDRRVALLLGERVRDVSAITEAFVEAMGVELSSLSEVHVNGLGRFSVRARQGVGPDGEPKKKYYVSFRKGRALNRKFWEKHGPLKEMNMDKLGVDESQADNEKVASEGCPLCGAKVEKHGNVLACPVHGTEPFEGGKKKA